MQAKFRETTLRRLPGDHYDQITTTAIPARVAPGPESTAPVLLDAVMAAAAFGTVSPAPFQYRFQYGLTPPEHGRVLAHPDSELWIRPAMGARHITWDFGILPGAYERGVGNRTDGVEFVVVAEASDGRQREVYRRLLSPATIAADRGLQHVRIDFLPAAGEALVFETRPNQNFAFDWAYWDGIMIN